MKVNFKKLREVPTPFYVTEGAAAMDLYAATDKVYSREGDYYEYKTGLAISVPDGYVGIIAPRSSITNLRMMLANGIGVIDSDFRGEISIRLKEICYTSEDTSGAIVPPHYKKGDRIAQLLIIPCPQVELVEVDELTETVRGEGGFGSTNVRLPKKGDKVRIIVENECKGITPGKTYEIERIISDINLSIIGDYGVEIGLYTDEIELI